MMLSPRPWLVELRRVVIGAVVLGVIGYVLGSPAIALLAGALAYLGWHLRQLFVLVCRRPVPRSRIASITNPPWPWSSHGCAFA